MLTVDVRPFEMWEITDTLAGSAGHGDEGEKEFIARSFCPRSWLRNAGESSSCRNQGLTLSWDVYENGKGGLELYTEVYIQFALTPRKLLIFNEWHNFLSSGILCAMR